MKVAVVHYRSLTQLAIGRELSLEPAESEEYGAVPEEKAGEYNSSKFEQSPKKYPGANCIVL
jgi:hypothetical protein